MTVSEKLEQCGVDVNELNIVIFENPSYDSAFIGISTDNRAIYDYDLMVNYLMTVEHLTEQDAIDMIEYNTLGSLNSGNFYPIVLHRM